MQTAIHGYLRFACWAAAVTCKQVNAIDAEEKTGRVSRCWAIYSIPIPGEIPPSAQHQFVSEDTCSVLGACQLEDGHSLWSRANSAVDRWTKDWSGSKSVQWRSEEKATNGGPGVPVLLAGHRLMSE